MDNITSRKILNYDDIVDMPVADNGEALVDVRTYDNTIEAVYKKDDMKSITGEVLYARDSLAKKLAKSNESLLTHGLRLLIVYGYRHPDVQGAYFNKRRADIAREEPTLSDSQLDRYTHQFVAKPGTAGHTVGGAVDLTLLDAQGEELDMGTKIADYSDPEKIRTYSGNLTQHQVENRSVLHDAMITQGFAPFYGEWWHFSYGDKEWAAFYGKASSLYAPVHFTNLQD